MQTFIKSQFTACFLKLFWATKKYLLVYSKYRYTQVFWVMSKGNFQRVYECRAVICVQTSETGQKFSNTSLKKAIHEMLSKLEVGGALSNAVIPFLKRSF